MAHINKELGFEIRGLIAKSVAAVALVFGASAALAQPVDEARAIPAMTPGEMASYADLVAFADSSDLVIRAQIRRQITVKPERAPGLKPGFARLYIEANTIALISGASAVGESLNYIVDVPLNAKGKAPKLKKQEVLLFVNRVPGRPSTVQLAGKTGQFAYTPALEQRLRPILTDIIESSAPPVVTGVSDALAVRGTLVGESETQVFLETDNGAPVSLTITRRPNQAPSWGVSWGEIIDASAKPPEAQSLQWYRLACALPDNLPSSANLSRNPDERRLATQDYRFVIESLGACERRVT